MDKMDNIDVKKLERLFLGTEAQLDAARTIISYLEQENKHLREVVEMLITTKSPSL